MSDTAVRSNAATGISPSTGTLLLDASAVSRCLPPDACREAVQRAFVMLADGRTPASRSLAFDAEYGSFHAKATLFSGARPLFVAKLNGNFPGNPDANGLPTIQGLLLVADARDGRPLALMDSARVTALRTAATSAVAIRHLARRDASVAAIIGCGLQGRMHVEALRALRPIREWRLHDRDPGRVARLAEWCGSHAGARVVAAATAREAARGADIVVTCTTGANFVLGAADVSPGAVVAGVGADSPRKRELEPGLMARSRIVVDDLPQCAASGDLHHALEAGAVRESDVHGDLAGIVSGRCGGRGSEDEIFVFDSTGIALEDAAAAEVVLERATVEGLGIRVAFAS